MNAEAIMGLIGFFIGTTFGLSIGAICMGWLLTKKEELEKKIEELEKDV